jgi:hypothetical protein
MDQLFCDLKQLTSIQIPALFAGILATAGIPAIAAVASFLLAALALLLLIMSLLILPSSFRGRHCCLKPFVAILLFLAGELSHNFRTAKILNVDFFKRVKKILRKEIGKKNKNFLFAVKNSLQNLANRLYRYENNKYLAKIN